MSARRARWSADSPPPRSRSPARHQIGNQTFSGCEPPAPGPRIPSQGQYRGLSAAPPRPPTPSPAPGATYRLAWASRCCRASRTRRPRALPGEKEKACRRSGRARSPPPLRRSEAPSARRRDRGGGISAVPQPRSEENPQRPHSGRREGQSDQSPGINYCAGARAPARAPEPPILPAGSREGARGAQGASRLRGSALGACGGSCVVAGEGTGNCPRGLEEPRRGDAGREAGAAAMGSLRAASQRFTRPPPDPPPRDSAPH